LTLLTGSNDVKPKSLEHAALGRAIRELRRSAGISQEGLAELSRLHRTYVGGIERGERNLSFSNLLRLANALGVQPSELLERSERLSRPAVSDREMGISNR
jgi:transcriptional regulator with XRE-family HTH domain